MQANFANLARMKLGMLSPSASMAMQPAAMAQQPGPMAQRKKNVKKIEKNKNPQGEIM